MTKSLFIVLLALAVLLAPAIAAPPVNNEAVTQLSSGVVLSNASDMRVSQISVGLVLIAGPATPPGATTVIFPAPLTHFR